MKSTTTPDRDVGSSDSSAPTYAQDAADLLARWRNGEDVQDALAHKLRHYAAGCATMHRQLDWLRENCRVVYYFPDTRYPLEHSPHAKKDMWAAILAESLPNAEIRNAPTSANGK